MDEHTALRAFDEQLRRRPAEGPDSTVEHDGHVTRYVTDTWNAVIWSHLDESDADDVIAEQVRRFAHAPEPWEWKYYSRMGPGLSP